MQYSITFRTEATGDGLAKVTREVRSLDAALSKINNTARTASSGLNGFSGAAKNVSNVLTAASAPAQQFAANMARLKSSVADATGSVGKSMGQFNAQIKAFHDVSQKMGTFDAHVKNFRESANQFGRASSLMERSLGGLTEAFGGTVVQLAKFYLAFKLIQVPGQLVGAFVQLSKTALDFASYMQSSRLGIASLIASFDQLEDATGRVLNPASAEGWAESLDRARGIQNQLKRAAIETAAEYEHLLRAMQEGIGPAIQAGFSDKQIVEFTKMMTQAAAAIRLPFDQLGQEVRAIFEGDMSRFSRITRLIFQDLQRQGINVKEQIEEWRQQGVLFDEVSKRLQFFAKAGVEAMNTWETALSNLRDATMQALGQAFLGAHEDATAALNTLTKAIVTFNEEGEAIYNPAVIGFLESMAGAVTGLAKAFEVALPLMTAWISGAAKVMEAVTTDPTAITNYPWTVIKSMWGGASEAKNLRDSIIYQRRLAQMEASREAGRQFFDPSAGAFAAGNMLAPGAFTVGANAGLGQMFGGFAESDSFGIAAQRMVAMTEEQIKAGQELAKEAEKSAKKMEGINKRASDIMKESSGIAEEHTKALNKVAEARARMLVPDERAEINLARQEQEANAAYEYGQALDALQGKLERVRESEAEGASPAIIAEQYRLANAERQRADEAYQEKRRSIAQITSDKIAKYDLDKAIEAHDQAIKDYAELMQERRDLIGKIFGKQTELQRVSMGGLDDMSRVIEENFAGAVSDGVTRGFAEAMRSGDIEDVFAGIADAISGLMLDGFNAALTNWAKQLQDIASNKPGSAGGKDPTGRQVKGAKAAQSLMIAGSAIYEIMQGGGTRSQNMVSGGMTGMMAGISIGALKGGMAAGIWGAVIGAVVGALLGAFAPTASGRDVKIRNVGGKIIVGGLGAQTTRRVLDDINTAIQQTMKSIDEILFGLPTNILEAISGMKRPKIGSGPGDIKIWGGAEGKNWNDDLKDFIQNEIPDLFVAAYIPLFQAAAEAGGATKERLKELATVLKGMDPQDALEFAKSYFGSLFDFKKVRDFFAMSPTERVGEARRIKNLTPVDAMRDLDSRISVLSQGFEKLDFVDQVRVAGQLKDMIDQRYQLEMDYINAIEDAREASMESIDKQIFGYQQATRSPQEQMDALLRRNQELEQRIQSARTPEELNKYLQEFQSNIDTMVQLGGGRPEDYKQAIATLTDIRARVDKKYDDLVTAALAKDDQFYVMINNILTTLQGGLEDIFNPATPGGIGAGPGNGRTPWNDIGPAADEFVTGTKAATIGLGDFTTAINNATITIKPRPGTQSDTEPTVKVEVYTYPQVTVSGDAAAVIDKVTATAASSAETRVMTRISRRESAGGRL